LTSRNPRQSSGFQVRYGTTLSVWSIRQEQIDAMMAPRQLQYQNEMIEYFRSTLPQVIDKHNDAALRDLITRGTAKAQVYGIESGLPLVQFLTLSLLISPDFDEEPAAKLFLTLPNVNPEAKLEILTQAVCERLRGSE
jgi:hypothetical protein